MRRAAFSPARCLNSTPSLAAPRTVTLLPLGVELIVTMMTVGFIFIDPATIGTADRQGEQLVLVGIESGIAHRSCQFLVAM
jgi:hypothetical protein